MNYTITPYNNLFSRIYQSIQHVAWFLVYISLVFLDQYQYLGNCPPTPPLTQQQSIDNKLRLMLG